MDSKKNSRIATDSIILVFIRIITMLVGIIQAMILARVLTKGEYGTYSQGILIITFLAPLVSLGMENAINYFYNKTIDTDKKKDYVNTIFLLTTLCGSICAVGIVVFRVYIAQYFNNPDILGIILYISLRPCIQNLIALYQPLYISSGYTRIIAIRNLIISLLQISIVGGIAIFSNDIGLMFFLLLFMDLSQLIVFSFIYKKKCFAVNILGARRECIKEIISYAIPMFVSVSIGTISINLDKLMIGGLMSVEEYALYSNMAKELPFSFVASSFTAVITPYIINYLNTGEKNRFQLLWKQYLEIGYKVTWPLCVGAIFYAQELIELLYSHRYLDEEGLIVFQLYCVVAMLRFTYFGIICAAVGKTKIILKYSTVSCIINVCLNYPLYMILGMQGPAWATVISMIISAILYFRTSSKIVNLKIREVLSFKDICTLFVEMIIIGLAIKSIMMACNVFQDNVFCLFTVEYMLFLGGVYLLNGKKIFRLFNSMNKGN